MDPVAYGPDNSTTAAGDQSDDTVLKRLTEIGKPAILTIILVKSIAGEISMVNDAFN